MPVPFETPIKLCRFINVGLAARRQQELVASLSRWVPLCTLAGGVHVPAHVIAVSECGKMLMFGLVISRCVCEVGKCCVIVSSGTDTDAPHPPRPGDVDIVQFMLCSRVTW